MKIYNHKTYPYFLCGNPAGVTENMSGLVAQFSHQNLSGILTWVLPGSPTTTKLSDLN